MNIQPISVSGKWRTIVLQMLGVAMLFLGLVACSRMGAAEVRVQDGKVCFTLTHEEFQRESGKMIHRGYYVEKQDKDKWNMVWGYYTHEPMPFKEGDCLPYGFLPKDAELSNITGEPPLPKSPQELQMNALYSVSVLAYTDIGSGGTQYGIKFCLRQNNGTIIVEQGPNLSLDQTCLRQTG